LLFLQKDGLSTFHYGEIRGLDIVLASGAIADGNLYWSKFQGNVLTDEPWKLYAGPVRSVMDKLDRLPKLKEIAANIFVGLQTSADAVYHLEDRGKADTGRRSLFSKTLGRVVTLEENLLHPLISGMDVKRYQVPSKRQYILFPYKIDNYRAILLTEDELARMAPLSYEYLRVNRETLEDRERGKFKDEAWYRFGRTQNLGIQEQAKICVPRLVYRIQAFLDEAGEFYLDNVDVGGLTLREGSRENYLYVLGLLNSKLLTFYLHQISTPFRGGWYSCNRQYLERLPISRIDFDDPAQVAQHDAVVARVEELLQLYARRGELPETDERAAVQAAIDAEEAALDVLVYELYGLTEEEIALVEGKG
jgi:hypothetical protein